MGMPKNLLFVRHGQSLGNAVKKQYVKEKDERFFTEEFMQIHESKYPLTEKGILQAKTTGLWLKGNGFIHFDRYLVSDHKRATHTAGYLYTEGAEWMIDANVRERDGGLFSTIKPSVRDEMYKDMQMHWATEPFYYRPPQGESIADVCTRVKIVLDTLARECDGKDVVVVCHGHLIRAARIIIERMSPGRRDRLLQDREPWAMVPNCSIVHYTRIDPISGELHPYLDFVRTIRPSGGGEIVDPFTKIIRKKFTNEELLNEDYLL